MGRELNLLHGVNISECATGFAISLAVQSYNQTDISFKKPFLCLNRKGFVLKQEA